MNDWCRRNSTLLGIVAAISIVLAIAALTTAALTWQRLKALNGEAQRPPQISNDEKEAARTALFGLVAELQRQLDKPAIATDEQRQALLNAALSGLRQVVRATDMAGTTDASAAIAHQQLGEIFLRLEKFDAAQEQLRQANELLARLRKAQPNESTLQHHLAECESALADLHVSEDRSGEARTHYKEAIGHLEALSTAAPENIEFQLQLAKAWQKLGQLEGADGTPTAMRAAYEKALQLSTQIAQAKPLDTEATERLATAHLELGSLDHSENQLDSAQQHYDAAVELITGLLDQHPDDNLRAILLPYLVTRGELAVERDQTTAAAADFRRTIELGQAIPESNQIPDDWLLMAVAHRRLAIPLIESDPPAALEELLTGKRLLEHARTELETQAARQHHTKKGENDSARGLEEIYADDVLAELAITNAKLALCMIRQDQREEGEKLLDEATVLASQFASVDPGGEDPWRETAAMLVDLAEAESLAGRTETARELLTEAAKVAEAVSIDEHATFADQQLVCRLYRTIIPLEEAAGMHKSSAKWLAKLVGVLDELQASKLLTDKPERTEWLEKQRQSLPTVEPPADKDT